MHKLNETDKIQAIRNSGVLSEILDVIPAPGVWIPVQNPVERPLSNLTKSYKALLHASDQCEKLGVAGDHKKKEEAGLETNHFSCRSCTEFETSSAWFSQEVASDFFPGRFNTYVEQPKISLWNKNYSLWQNNIWGTFVDSLSYRYH